MATVALKRTYTQVSKLKNSFNFSAQSITLSLHMFELMMVNANHLMWKFFVCKKHAH